MMELCRFCLDRRVPDASCGICRGAALPVTDAAALPAGTWLVAHGETTARYLLGRVLGSGGFGIAYIARNLLLDQRVAIKELYPREHVIRTASGTVSVRSATDHDEFEWARRQFVSEARTLARIDDPRCVRVTDIVEANGTAYMVMQYIEGATLTDVRLKAGGRLPTNQVAQLGREIAQGLAAVHAQDLLHRDVKPDNAMLSDTGQVKLIDFGAARFVGRDGASRLSSVFTPGYAPPEQMVDPTDQPPSMRQGPWSDLYSLGATLYELTTGQRPTNAMTRVMQGQATLRPAPRRGDRESTDERSLFDAIESCLHLDPTARPRRAAEVLERLHARPAPAARAPITTAPITTPPKPEAPKSEAPKPAPPSSRDPAQQEESTDERPWRQGFKRDQRPSVDLHEKGGSLADAQQSGKGAVTGAIVGGSLAAVVAIFWWMIIYPHNPFWIVVGSTIGTVFGAIFGPSRTIAAVLGSSIFAAIAEAWGVSTRVLDSRSMPHALFWLHTLPATVMAMWWRLRKYQAKPRLEARPGDPVA